MSTEASTRLVSKLIILLCLIFTLCQLGSDFKSGCIAQEFLDGKLPDEEARALKEVVSGLNFTYRGDFLCNESSNIGITCNCNNDTNICHITEVILTRMGLNGVIPEEVVSLTHLERLDLSYNQLTGSIPANLGNLSSLYYLDLKDNQLNGSIPESLGNLTFPVSMLKPEPHGKRILSIKFRLDLSLNQLSGSIPTTLGNVAVSSVTSDPDAYRIFKSKQYDTFSDDNSYFYLYLSYNQLTGTIPESLGNLTFANYLSLSDNFLKGSIPKSLGALKYLNELNLRNNGISGTLPPTLKNLTRLQYFWVESNRITGTMPKSFARLTKMTKFSVGGNQLSGPLPDFIANWTSIVLLSLGGNNFHGNIPVGIFNLSSLQILEISDVEDSQFQFPPSTNLTDSLYTLILRNCSISGHIPAYIGDMSKLQALDLSFNSLTGRIPDSLKKVNLRYMSLSNNMLTGAVPDWIFNRNVMDLSYNNFTTLIFKPSPNPLVNLFACCCNSSTCVSNTTDPTRIIEKYCPRGKPNYHSLFINCGGGEIYDMDGNVYEKDNDTSPFYLSPKGNWARSSDRNTIVTSGLSSEAVLYDKARSSLVSLKYYGLCLRKGKYSVTLHFDDIGQNKKYFQDKRVFDIYIQGERKLKDFNIIDKAGGPNKVHKEIFTAVNVNHSTLEIHFYSTGGSGLSYPWVEEDHGPLISAISVTPELNIHDEKLRLLRIASISGAGLGLGLGVLLLLIGAWRGHKAIKKRKIIKRRQLFFKRNGGLLLEQQISSGKVNVEKIKLFNSKELEKCTDNFNINRVLGQGGQGTVFKGMLADGNIVAVKKSKIDDKGKVLEFINEVIILSQINHRNIVRLLGCCLETEVPLLVYEFIPNGTLSQYIYEPNEEFPLTWKMRLQIAIEIAGALHYLHAAASCPIYHRDIKSTNILLDERYKAKIADFGISRSVAIDQTHLTTNVHGTFGYMDPEYFQSCQFTEKSDVYSFGVVLVELLTGKKPISAVTRSTEEEQEQEYRSLATYFIVSMQEDCLFNILDARVANEGSEEDIMIVANLARRCLNLNGRNRPTMREVITELEAIQMSNKTHHQGPEFIPKNYPIQQYDDVVPSSRGSTWDSGPTSSSLEFPQSSM